ncbi:MAG: hisD [Daejeonella sp.]|nr:hisD [Daejeonella sp.]
MLKLYILQHLSKSEVKQLCVRNADTDNSVGAVVESIISRVKTEGDIALKSFAREFDKIELGKLYLDNDELIEFASRIGEHQKEALRIAY